MFNKPTSLPGLPASKKSDEAANVMMQHAFALGTALGLSDRQIAAAAMRLAVVIAERDGDPDGWLKTIMSKGA